ncbi:homeobox-leucine zipper protein ANTHOCYANINLESS 2-like [Abrus precatorius]|uniref:Homeobox-leucine zipper protein ANTHOCYANINLESS 2-like n=1 Tax=Abrus precatorius TaxID=3816 RepID=A0A8B8LRL6_ABRPR|nr:homeobox-leucine zipper protein ANTHOCYANINLESS 2-like [Abrus precatorius]XP_027359025.1 homeobox-leucine zipper protein ANTHOCYANINLESS 2-like [Abrus precatorius]XP_027359026.1 homeobox-leucine zipper protein ANTHOCYANINLESS 2-like [Abrus precatorius]
MEGNSEMGLLGESFDTNFVGRMRDDEYESRSGSDNFDGGSGDDQDAGDDQPQKKKKKYHRHTPQQIQELEAFFKECPHPDEKQRSDLSKRLGLENKQVKFWFQNRRTQMKTQLERHENMILRQENERLRAENSVRKDALANPICNNCGGPAVPGQISLEEHQTRIENARLKEELNRICALANKFLGRPLSSLASPIPLPASNSGLELAIGRNGMNGSGNFGMSLPMGLDVADGVLGSSPAMSGMSVRSPMGMIGNEVQIERSMLLDLALTAMDELIKLAQPDTPLWIKSPDGRNEVLNHEEYARTFSPYHGPKPTGYVTEATRETGIVLVNSLALVETLMDTDRWSEMFSCVVASAVTLDVISGGMGGTRNGALQVMLAEVQLLSPLVPVRQLSFLRFCKQHAEGVWVVVDVSVDIGRNATNAQPLMSCRRLPSGCIVQDMPNGLSKITWVDHYQYDESVVHQLYRPLVNSGIGFGAQRWINTLLRQCECFAILMSPIPSEDPTALNQSGKRSMLKLSQRMTDYFCSGICASSTRKWDVLHVGNLSDDMRIMARKNVDDPSEAGIVLSASTSVWMPVSRQRVFDFLRDGQLRGEWDMLSNGGPMQEMLHIAKGQEHGNCVSILRAANSNESNVLYLQESWSDTSGSMVVYSPINMQSLNMVMSCEDSSFVTLRPSGFVVLPDGHSNNGDGSGGSDSGGSLLTVGLQMLQNGQHAAKLTVESIETVNNLITCTIQKIKDALGVA